VTFANVCGPLSLIFQRPPHAHAQPHSQADIALVYERKKEKEKEKTKTTHFSVSRVRGDSAMSCEHSSFPLFEAAGLPIAFFFQKKASINEQT
jgi:hypothetical protein